MRTALAMLAATLLAGCAATQVAPASQQRPAPAAQILVKGTETFRGEWAR